MMKRMQDNIFVELKIFYLHLQYCQHKLIHNNHNNNNHNFIKMNKKKLRVRKVKRK
jgi:hypothetical protein